MPEPAEQKKPMTADDVRAVLRRECGGNVRSVVFEVARGTGWAANRHLDAIIMDLWPSHGLGLHGIEIKVSRGDFRRELKQPEKAEQIASFCDYFWIAAPVGVVPVNELPHAWGLYEITDKGKIVTVQKAHKTDAAPLTRQFLAAIMRAASRQLTPGETDALIGARMKELNEDFDRRVQIAVKNRETEELIDADKWRALVKAIGRDPEKFYQDYKLTAAVKLAMECDISPAMLKRVRNELDTSIKNIDKALAELPEVKPNA